MHYTFYFYFFKIPKKHNSNDTFNLIKMKKALHKGKEVKMHFRLA